MNLARLGVAALSAAVLLSSATVSAAEQPAPSGVLSLAHRGDARDAPEHTLAALDQAVSDHADRLSIDVRMTSDGVPVVVHDSALSRTTDVEERFPGRAPFRVRDLTLAEIRTLDAGSWRGAGPFTGSRVLTLDEVLTELAGSPSGLTVEIKEPLENGGVAGVGRAVLGVLHAHPEWPTGGSDPRLVVECFPSGSTGWSFLDDLHAADPALALVLLGNVTPGDLTAHPYVREIDVPFRSLTGALVAAAHAAGLRVGTWTVDAAADMRAALAIGVDGITSDDPRLLRDVLAAAGRTWSGSTWRTGAVTRLAVDVPAAALLGTRIRAVVRPVGAAGAPLRWQEVTVQTLANGRWRTAARTATDSHGAATVSLAAADGLQVRALSGARISPTRTVMPHVAHVLSPAGAPAPSRPLRAQSRTGAVGARPSVGPLPARVWAEMTGRTWRRGCPVGRARLRLLRVGYWGFDGVKHRGELVVAAGSASRLGRVFARLYDARVPVRSLRRPETLGGWSSAVGRAVRADAGFGFACQRTPGDTHAVGSHARGTVVALNPWENPTRVRSRGLPNTWWLSRTRASRAVHRTGSAAVAAFAAEGFAWNGGRGRYAEFRDTR